MTDARIVEQVLAALDKGVDAQWEALRAVVAGDEGEVRKALAAVEHYRHRIDAERLDRSSGPLDIDGPLTPGTVLGDYCIEHTLGSGAMGVVYRARQISLDRAVALKVLPKHLGTRDPRFIARFRREAGLAAAIHHPHIAEVHCLVDAGGTLAFAMRLVDGPTLHDVLKKLARENVAPIRTTTSEHVRRCVLLVRALADALALIHASGLVHRDVKPGNVLLEGGGREPLSGSPVLVDFGLVRPTSESELTNTQTMLGTPAYASHESTLGQTVDARADVFSLGATLHDLLTVTSPGTRGPATAGLPDVRAINPTVDAGLAAIVAMALQQDRELRYEHGGSFRDELDCWLRGEPIRALPTSLFGRLGLWVRRDRRRAALVTATLVLVVAVFATSVFVVVRDSWHLSRVADAAMAHESDGELVDAAKAFLELRQSHLAPWLLWLAKERGRAEDYWGPAGALQPIITQLLRANDARQASDAIGETAALEIAGDRMCAAIRGDRHAEVQDAIAAHLMREAGAETTEHRRRVALDTLTNVLIVREQLPNPKAIPPSAYEVIRASAFGPAAATQTPTIEAAASALAALRSCAAFQDLVNLFKRANTPELAEHLRLCTSYAFDWITEVDRDTLLRLDATVLDAWANAMDARRDAVPTDAIKRLAHQLLRWQEICLRTGRPINLLLPASVRNEMDAAKSCDDQSWRCNLEPSRFDATIWGEPTTRRLLASRILDDHADPRGQPIGVDQERGPSRLQLLRGDDGQPPRARVTGTLLEASIESGQIQNGDDPLQRAFLRLDRPGHSRVRVVSTVPELVHRLDIRIEAMLGSRSPLRNGGTVHYRVRINGLISGSPPTPLPFTYESVATNPAIISECGMADACTVPVGVFLGYDEIEVVYEYVRGNTTHRVLDLELVWNAR